MRYTLLYIIGLIMIVSCSDGHDESSYVSPEGFVVDIMLPTTPVQNQGKTEFCWIYATLAALETDRLAQGDSVSLSPLWLERWMMEETTRECYFTGRQVSFRGTLSMAIRLIDEHGLVTNDSYHPKYEKPTLEINTHVLARQLTHLAKIYASQRRSYKDLQDTMAAMLNDSIGYPPDMTYLYGAEYSPKEYANSCYLPGDWQTFTSFTHHPYNQPFIPELKDNQWHLEAMNLSMDSLMCRVVASLKYMHPVMWEGSMKEGLPQDRQQAFEKHILTDDHCMCIVGMGHDKNGTQYFVLKNSWGIHDGDKGFRYMSFDQFRQSVILVMMKKS